MTVKKWVNKLGYTYSVESTQYSKNEVVTYVLTKEKITYIFLRRDAYRVKFSLFFSV
jgi:hypothetical protein